MGYSFLRSTPEAQGIPSSAILSFIEEVEREHIELNAFILMRNNCIVAEGYWSPFRAGVPHRLFSAGKAVVALAVMFAIQEGYFRLETPIPALLGREMPEGYSDRWNRLTIYHMLTMHTGHGADTFAAMLLAEDRIQSFLSQELTYEPGTHFLYNNGVPDVLGYLVQKYTGQNVCAYLDSRLFKPLEMDGIYAADGPFGIEMPTMCTSTQSMLKMTCFLRDNGRWNGKQLLDAELVRMATSYLVPSLQNPAPEILALDTMYGYGFQIWRNSVGGFRIDGGRGQFGICIPDSGLVMAIQSNEQDQDIIPRLVWKHITNKLFANPIAGSPADYRTLCSKLNTLSLAFRDTREGCRGSFSFLLSQPLLEVTRLDVTAGERVILKTDYAGGMEIDCGIPGSGSWAPCPPGFAFPEITDSNSISIHRAVPGCDPTKVLACCRYNDQGALEIVFRSHGWLGGYYLTLPLKDADTQIIWDTAYSYNVSRRSNPSVSLQRRVMPDRKLIPAKLG